MTDLIKELRASYDPNDAVPMQICLDAADHIEKLEEALREIAALGYWDGDSAMSIAHKALEGKNGNA